jgi:hypothetical protein
MARRKSKLSTQQKKTLQLSSRRTVQDVFARLRPYFRRYLNNGRWIGISNRYCDNTVDKLFRDTNGGRNNVNHKQLSQYILVSAPLHCADGWDYLGRAIDCLARGDADVARHLGYYAELRAAMSLLAAEGIGVFNNRHFVLDHSYTCRLLPKSQGRDLRTHEIAWLCLEHWANRKTSTDLLEEIISPGGIPLRNWLDDFGVTSKRPIGSEWLISWGLDLRRLSDDREARNEASYRPTRLIPKMSLDAIACSEFLRNLWALYQPYGDSRFEALDRHLLRLTLRKAYKAITGNDVQADLHGFEMRIDKMLRDTIPSGAVPGGLPEKVWSDFLTGRLRPDTPVLFIEASRTDSIDNPRHHLQVIARSALLLRVATGACARLLREIDLGSTDLEFWWQPLGEEMGLWEPNIEPEELTDLWADVELALEEIRDWEVANQGRQVSFARWWRERAQPISVLGGCERIALWGLGL